KARQATRAPHAAQPVLRTARARAQAEDRATRPRRWRMPRVTRRLSRGAVRRRSFDVRKRVYRFAVLQDLEMQVGPGRPTGGAEPCNGLTASHHIPHSDQILRVVRIARDETAAVVDLH